MILKLGRLALVCVSAIAFSLMLTPISNAKIDPGNFIALWLLDDGKGDVAKDSSGNGREGSVEGGPQWVQGRAGWALQFDGEDDVVNFGKSSDLQPEIGTVHIWFKFDEVKDADINQLFDKGVHSNDNGIALYYNVINPPPKNLVARWRGGGTDIKLEHEMDMTNDTDWHHAAVVWDTTNGKKFYLDGELVGESDNTNTVPICEECPFLIAQAVGREYDFKGFIDEVAIFDIALTANEVKELMNERWFSVSPSGRLVTVWGSIKSN